MKAPDYEGSRNVISNNNSFPCLLGTAFYVTLSVIIVFPQNTQTTTTYCKEHTISSLPKNKITLLDKDIHTTDELNQQTKK